MNTHKARQQNYLGNLTKISIRMEGLKSRQTKNGILVLVSQKRATRRGPPTSGEVWPKKTFWNCGLGRIGKKRRDYCQLLQSAASGGIIPLDQAGSP